MIGKSPIISKKPRVWNPNLLIHIVYAPQVEEINGLSSTRLTKSLGYSVKANVGTLPQDRIHKTTHTKKLQQTNIQTKKINSNNNKIPTEDKLTIKIISNIRK